LRISVVIPTANEAARLPDTVAAIRRLPGEFEIIVADGGSTDATVDLAERLGVRVVRCPRGRGRQMNMGAAAATGDVLLFLHADTRLPQSAHHLVTAALDDRGVAGGCFQLSFDRDSPGLRFSAFVTRFSFSLFHYGDSAYFVRTTAFRALGGYRPYPIMEDIDLWRRLRKRARLVVLDAPVVTSSRRFDRHGVFKQQCLGCALLLLFLAGVPPARLERFYGEVR
jgi:rSAM/selenodomain-associated transferase 2